MSNQTHDPADKWARGKNAKAFNNTNELSFGDQFKVQDARASRLPSQEKAMFEHLTKSQNEQWVKLLDQQNKVHNSEKDKLIHKHLMDMDGFNMTHTSPEIRDQKARGKASREMANREQKEQHRLLKEFVTQREGFLNFTEIEVAKRQASEDKKNSNDDPNNNANNGGKKR